MTPLCERCEERLRQPNSDHCRKCEDALADERAYRRWRDIGQGFAFFYWRRHSEWKFVSGDCNCAVCASNWRSDWLEGRR